MKFLTLNIKTLAMMFLISFVCTESGSGEDGIEMKSRDGDAVDESGSGEDDAMKFLKFYEMIEDQDDVQKTFANFEIPDEVMEKLGG